MSISRRSFLASSTAAVAALSVGGAAEGLLAVMPTKVRVFFGTYTGKESKGIYTSVLDLKTGAITKPELAAEIRNPSFLAIHPRGTHLYAAGEIGDFQGGKGGAISAFAMEPATGKLTLLNQRSSVGGGPCHVTVDPTGKAVQKDSDMYKALDVLARAQPDLALRFDAEGREAVGPFHEDDAGFLKEIFEAECGQIGAAIDAVKVNVVDGQRCGRGAAKNVDQREGGAGDIFFSRGTQAADDALGQRGLPCSQFTGEQHQARRRKQGGNGPALRDGFFRIVSDSLHLGLEFHGCEVAISA